MSQAYGEQKSLELAWLSLGTFSEWPFTVSSPLQQNFDAPGALGSLCPRPTRLAGEKRHEDLGSIRVETLLPNGCFSSALGRDIQANVSWAEAVYMEGEGLLCRFAFPSSGGGAAADSGGLVPGHASRLTSSSLGHASGKREFL